jgi:CRP-like cAMP-binding protein
MHRFDREVHRADHATVDPRGPRSNSGYTSVPPPAPVRLPADLASLPLLATHLSSGVAPREKNHLLRLLEIQAPREHQRLASALEPVDLARGELLFEPGGPIPSVYFPEGCVASLVRILSDGKQIEVGTAGFEGMAGLPVFLDADSSPLECVIQVPGAAKRLSAATLRTAAPSGTALHAILQRYAQYLFDQATQSTVCIQMHGVEERCARWLLMTHDRVQGDRFELTQGFIAIMLGVHRPAVTLAAGALQNAGLIRYRRGKITILDRPGLEAAACECYRSDRADLERLLPQEDEAEAAS